LVENAAPGAQKLDRLLAGELLGQCRPEAHRAVTSRQEQEVHFALLDRIQGRTENK
jgi:hypothetical protein